MGDDRHVIRTIGGVPQPFEATQRGECRVSAPFGERDVRALSQGEGQFREFKSAWDRRSDPPGRLNWKSLRDKIADVVAAFANADGGLLFVGVEDDGRPSGHGYDDDAVRGLLSVPESRLQPEVRCRTGRVEVSGKEVLVFEVPQ